MVALDVDGNVWAWGAGASGALGNNSTADSYRAIQVDPTHNVIPPPPVGVSQVICGGSSFCLAVTRGGALIGWGNNGSGQLGIGTTAYTTVPVTIPVPVFVERVAAGAYHSLARGRDGNVWVWGYNGWGQLGNPQAAVNQRSPILMSSSTGMSGITDVAAGFYFSLMSRATAYDRTIFAVGDNQSGQLGINNHTQQNQPVQTSF
jgi:alpha-tubulin suppressor-like RCC1 family protein